MINGTGRNAFRADIVQVPFRAKSRDAGPVNTAFLSRFDLSRKPARTACGRASYEFNARLTLV